MVQGRGEFFGLFDLGAAVPYGQLSIFVGWNESQHSVRSTLVVMVSPRLNLGLCIIERHEPLVFKHSSRSRPLNDSTRASSVGLPRRLKSKLTDLDMPIDPAGTKRILAHCRREWLGALREPRDAIHHPNHLHAR